MVLALQAFSHASGEKRDFLRLLCGETTPNNHRERERNGERPEAHQLLQSSVAWGFPAQAQMQSEEATG